MVTSPLVVVDIIGFCSLVLSIIVPSLLIERGANQKAIKKMTKNTQDVFR